MPAPGDLIHQQSVSTGTGNLTLSTVNGKRSFNDEFGTGGIDKFDYYISNQGAPEWERGAGHLSTSNTLVRDTILASSNANAAVNFSAGTKDVVNDVPAQNQFRGRLIPQDFGAKGDGVTDDYAALQTMFDYAALKGSDWFIPTAPSVYLTSQPLTVHQPSTALGFTGPDRSYYTLPPPRWEMAQGAIIRAVDLGGGAWSASDSAVLTFGGTDSDWSQYLRNANIVGGVIDANFVAKYCVAVPFFNSCFVWYQHAKNYLKRGWNMGSTSAPAASAGPKHISCTTYRDTQPFRGNITGITNANPAVVTCSGGHGYPVGTKRVATIDNCNITQLNNSYFDIDIISTTQFTLLNTDTSALAAFTGTAQAYLTFPSMRIPKFISGFTNANPGVVTTSTPHLFTTGDSIFLADLGNVPECDGRFTVTVLTATAFSIGANSTSWGVYDSASGPGCAVQWVDPDTVEIGVYYENATDADDKDCQFVGNRICFRSNPATGGYDGKHTNCHHYNYNEHGEMWTAYDVAGDNSFDDCQVDGPFRFAFQVRGDRNRITTSNVNYSGGQHYDLYACPIRVEVGGVMRAYHNAWKANNASFRLLKDCSGNLAGFACDERDYSNMYSPRVLRENASPVAWVRFTPGVSPAIVESLKVSGVVRNAAGDYTINLVDPAATTGRTHVTAQAAGGGGQIVAVDLAPASVYSRRVQTWFNGALTDPQSISVTMYGVYNPASGVGAAP